MRQGQEYTNNQSRCQWCSANVPAQSQLERRARPYNLPTPLEYFHLFWQNFRELAFYVTKSYVQSMKHQSVQSLSTSPPFVGGDPALEWPTGLVLLPPDCCSRRQLTNLRTCSRMASCETEITPNGVAVGEERGVEYKSPYLFQQFRLYILVVTRSIKVIQHKPASCKTSLS